MSFESRTITSDSDSVKLEGNLREDGSFYALWLAVDKREILWDGEDWLINSLYPALQRYANRQMTAQDKLVLTEGELLVSELEDALEVFEHAEKLGWFEGFKK
jgi:hypothetical protein